MEVAEPQARLGQHSGIGYELVLTLDVPVLQMVEQPVDASALAVLEEAEAKDLEVEYTELVRSGFHKSPALLERMREVVRRRQVLRQKGSGRRRRRRRRRGRSDFLALLVLAWCLGAAWGVHGLVPVSYALLGFTVDTRSCVGPGGSLGRIPHDFYVKVALGPHLETWTFHTPRYLARTCLVPVALEEHRKIGVFWVTSTRFYFDGPLYLAVTCSADACGVQD